MGGGVGDLGGGGGLEGWKKIKQSYEFRASEFDSGVNPVPDL